MYKAYRLEDTKGSVLPNGARSCARCLIRECDCFYELMKLLKRGRKGHRLVGISVEDDKAVTLATNTADYAGPPGREPT